MLIFCHTIIRGNKDLLLRIKYNIEKNKDFYEINFSNKLQL